MLVLTREVNESIELTIPPSTETRLVTVTVTQIRGRKVRIATEAPREIGIDRSELKPATAG